MKLTTETPAPYTTVAAMRTVLDWFRTKSPSGSINANSLVRADVPDSLAARTARALRALGLTDDEGMPTTEWTSLANIRGDEAYRAAFQEWLRDTYSDVLSFCDPSSDDHSKVMQGFHGYQPAGQRASMATLLIGLWEYAGLPVAATTSTTSTSRVARPVPMRRISERQRSLGNRLPRTNSSATEPVSRSFVEAADLNLPQGLVGLLHQIPKGGQGWTAVERDRFLTAFTAVLDFTVAVVPTDTTVAPENEGV